jgi:hypothetical protein
MLAEPIKQRLMLLPTNTHITAMEVEDILRELEPV